MRTYWVEHFTPSEFKKFALKEDEIEGRMTPIEASSSEEAIQKAQEMFPNDVISKKTFPRK